MKNLKRYEYSFVYIHEVYNGELKTERFEVRSKKSNDLLGIIKWNGPCREYCFYGEPGIFLGVELLETLSYFIVNLSREWRG